MSNDFYEKTLADIGNDVSPAWQDAHLSDVPTFFDHLPDGREVLIYGDINGDRALLHRQGQNILGFEGDCGLVSCEEILREFGHNVTENDVVIHAFTHGECSVSTDATVSGGSQPEKLAQLLREMNAPAHTEVDTSLESLADKIESGYGTIVGVNAGYLWNDNRFVDYGKANHAVVVTGVARDVVTGAIAGFYINDSGSGPSGDAGRFVSADLMEKAYINAGATCIVTEDTRPYRGAAIPSV